MVGNHPAARVIASLCRYRIPLSSLPFSPLLLTFPSFSLSVSLSCTLYSLPPATFSSSFVDSLQVRLYYFFPFFSVLVFFFFVFFERKHCIMVTISLSSCYHRVSLHIARERVRFKYNGPNCSRKFALLMTVFSKWNTFFLQLTRRIEQKNVSFSIATLYFGCILFYENKNFHLCWKKFLFSRFF